MAKKAAKFIIVNIHARDTSCRQHGNALVF